MQTALKLENTRLLSIGINISSILHATYKQHHIYKYYLSWIQKVCRISVLFFTGCVQNVLILYIVYHVSFHRMTDSYISLLLISVTNTAKIINTETLSPMTNVLLFYCQYIFQNKKNSFHNSLVCILILATAQKAQFSYIRVKKQVVFNRENCCIST